MYKVAFLFDKRNNWIKKFINKNIFQKNKKYKYNFVDNINKLKNYDLTFILGYTKIIKQQNLEKNKLNLVVHESNLPKGKGFAPVQLYANRSELSRLMSEADSEESDHWKFQALRDADKVINEQPGWSRGYSRRGNALATLGRNLRAVRAYDKALEIDPDNSTVAAARQATMQKLS